MLLSPCLQWVLYAIIPSVYKIYRPPFGRDDILHITLLLRKRAICGNIVPRAGHNIQIHSGIIAHISGSNTVNFRFRGKFILPVNWGVTKSGVTKSGSDCTLF